MSCLPLKRIGRWLDCLPTDLRPDLLLFVAEFRFVVEGLDLALLPGCYVVYALSAYPLLLPLTIFTGKSYVVEWLLGYFTIFKGRFALCWNLV